MSLALTAISRVLASPFVGGGDLPPPPSETGGWLDVGWIMLGVEALLFPLVVWAFRAIAAAAKERARLLEDNKKLKASISDLKGSLDELSESMQGASEAEQKRAKALLKRIQQNRQGLIRLRETLSGLAERCRKP